MSDDIILRRFSIYRWDIHGRPGVFEGAHRTVAEVLAFPYDPNEEYWILVDHKKSYPIAEFKALALVQSFEKGKLP